MKFKKWIKTLDLNDVLPISCSYNSINHWIISLGNIGKKASPNLNWNYLPFQVKYATKERAEEVRLEILKVIYKLCIKK